MEEEQRGSEEGCENPSYLPHASWDQHTQSSANPPVCNFSVTFIHQFIHSLRDLKKKFSIFILCFLWFVI